MPEAKFQPGDRVRVKQPGGATWEGELLRKSDINEHYWYIRTCAGTTNVDLNLVHYAFLRKVEDGDADQG